VNVDKTEILILKNLIFNDDYTRKVLPFLKLDYFQDYSQRVIFEEIGEFINDYNKLPSLDALEIELERRTDLNESSF